MNYWHMQMHPTSQIDWAQKHLDWVLEHRQFIGLGEWAGGEAEIHTFKNEMEVNDIVAIKRGQELVALVQVIGGAYFVPRETEEDKDIAWIQNRRPVRVLDWAINGETLPQPRGTINRCASDDVTTTKIIKDWHERVNASLKKRRINLTV